MKEYNKVYDFTRQKYISTHSSDGKELIKKYSEIYNCLSAEGRHKVNKLFKMPNNNLITCFLNCQSCQYKNIDSNAIYCSKCGNSLKSKLKLSDKKFKNINI